MLPELSKLSTSEKELVYRAPLLVCILIAGADGQIDNKEINEAITIARDRQWVKAVLTNYFLEVSEDFEDKIKMVIQSYPYETALRNKAITEELEGLNLLWEKMSPDFCVSFYESLKFLAQRIASSSGGFWGKISREEAELLNLPMISDPGKI
jgi:hypothetical protein